MNDDIQYHFNGICTEKFKKARNVYRSSEYTEKIAQKWRTFYAIKNSVFGVFV